MLLHLKFSVVSCLSCCSACVAIHYGPLGGFSGHKETVLPEYPTLDPAHMEWFVAGAIKHLDQVLSGETGQPDEGHQQHRDVQEPQASTSAS